MVKGSTLYWVHPDHLGRPEMATNGSGQRVWRAANWAFNRSVLQDQIGGYNLGFPGQYYDAESNLWQNGFRDYEPSLGRYMQSDPIGLAGGISTYAYVGGNPLASIDSLGLCPEEPERDYSQEALASYSTEDSLNAIVGFGVGTAVAGTGAQVGNKSAIKPRGGIAGGGPGKNYTSYSRRYLGRGIGRTLGRMPVSAVATRAGIIGAGYGAYLEHRDALFALIACLNGKETMVASDD